MMSNSDITNQPTNQSMNPGKFLVDYQGNPYKRFGPTTEPFAMKEDIEELLKQRNEKKEQQ